MENIEKTVLCYIEKDQQYLMLYRNKKKNDLSEGKWMGVGGHIENGETPDMALIREVKEETNLDLLSYTMNGIVYFQNDEYKEVMYVYTSDAFKGNIKECNEGELHFIPKNQISSLNIWEGDKVFLKYLEDKNSFFQLRLIYQGKKLMKVEKLGIGVRKKHYLFKKKIS